jgi:radical SAM enzyme (TIGR01210 family)
MVKKSPFHVDDKWIKALREEKNQVDPGKPYGCLTEKERSKSGKIEETATIFLTNKECPFTCLMCDLWKNTMDSRISAGDIPRQIEWALSRLPETKQIKLYNSGNFFDVQAIPHQDYQDIATLLTGFETVIVESHPKLINDKCLNFNEMLEAELQVAIGLETIHPEVLRSLNKRMNLKDFVKSVKMLTLNGIQSRAFILLRPPFLSENEGIEWAKKSIDFAFDCGVECCVIIPTRSGNGAMNWLQSKGLFSPPVIRSLEEVLDYGINLKAGRVFADLWDVEQFSKCRDCFPERKLRLEKINLEQQVLSPVKCTCE